MVNHQRDFDVCFYIVAFGAANCLGVILWALGSCCGAGHYYSGRRSMSLVTCPSLS